MIIETARVASKRYVLCEKMPDTTEYGEQKGGLPENTHQRVKSCIEKDLKIRPSDACQTLAHGSLKKFIFQMSVPH
jgi:hypothetical protein